MSKFLYDLRDKIEDKIINSWAGAYIDDDGYEEIINNIHPNIEKHIKIAELENEIERLGWREKKCEECGCKLGYSNMNIQINYFVYFLENKIVFSDNNIQEIFFCNTENNKEFSYTSSTLNEDVITHIKKLMEKNDE